jgi:hypothetical protein
MEKKPSICTITHIPFAVSCPSSWTYYFIVTSSVTSNVSRREDEKYEEHAFGGSRMNSNCIIEVLLAS